MAFSSIRNNKKVKIDLGPPCPLINGPALIQCPLKKLYSYTNISGITPAFRAGGAGSISSLTISATQLLV